MKKNEGKKHVYGEGGTPDWYNSYSENQPDFDTKYANNYSTNGTDQNRGQFPFLLYEHIWFLNQT